MTKETDVIYSRRWYYKNPDKVRNAKYKRNYGISLDDYNELFQKQNGLCAICFKPETRMKYRLHIDHCHGTGKIRGLLCNTCNRALGLFKDNPEVLLRAYKYLDLD